MLPPDLRQLLARIITVLSRPSDPGRSGSSRAQVALCQTWDLGRDFALAAGSTRSPFVISCPDVLRLVGDPLSGNGCGSPKSHLVLIISFLLVLFTQFIVDKMKKKSQAVSS